MASASKKRKNLNISLDHISLDNLYIRDRGQIISWLDEIKAHKSGDGKIPGLLNNSKIQIITATEDGSYNLILQWIKDNRDKFADYDFTGIPDSAFISLKDISSSNAVANATNAVAKTFKTVQDVERWFKDPEIHPIKGTPMSAMSEEYYNIYENAYKIMKRGGVLNISLDKDYITTHNLFPKNHLLFGDIDLIYYTCVKKNNSNYKRLYEDNEDKLAICELLTEKLEESKVEKTKFETEVDLLRNRYSTNAVILKELFNNFKEDLEESFLDADYMSIYEYPERMEALQNDSDNIECYWYINFLENNKMANGDTVLKYFEKTLNEPNPPNWILEALTMYNDYKLVFKDIDNCFNPVSGIIENVEDKKYTLINDPLDDYFEVYEKQLEEIRKPVYSQLIDLTTFKPKENLKYLNNAQYKAFKREKDRYDVAWKKYSERQTLYETTKQGSSPEPPEKPKITLPWGKVHTIAKEIDPIHINDDVVAKFKKEYEKAKPTIDEYNKIKNMSYKQLKKHFGSSPSSSEKLLIEGSELLAMTRKDITNNILFDYTDLADKCSENIDILTNEELDDENYPLSKLQLMARLKVYTPDKKKYRTECIYAPKLYNYLIKCINSKEPFVNPVTKAKYTQENIEELMKVMRIIDPKIEVPVFIKHMNDTRLKINYISYSFDIADIDTNRNFGSIQILNFYNIYISRVIGGVEKIVYELCHIPADIEATGELGTGSTDLTSNTMLFRIFKLFNDGRLLHNYLPPYRIPSPGTVNQFIYIKPVIHFNRYKGLEDWVWGSNNITFITKQEFIDRFKHYAQEINNYTF